MVRTEKPLHHSPCLRANGHWTELPELSRLREIDRICRLTDRKCLVWYKGCACKDAVVGSSRGSGSQRAPLRGDEVSHRHAVGWRVCGQSGAREAKDGPHEQTVKRVVGSSGFRKGTLGRSKGWDDVGDGRCSRLGLSPVMVFASGLPKIHLTLRYRRSIPHIPTLWDRPSLCMLGVSATFGGTPSCADA